MFFGMWRRGVTFLPQLLSRSASNVQKGEKRIVNNPYYKRYRYQLETIKLISPELYERKLEELVNPVSAVVPEKPKPILLPGESNPKEVIEKSPDFKKHLSKSFKQDLNSIMKLELLRDKSPEEIEKIWNSYHLTKPCVSAVLPPMPYTQYIKVRSKKWPMFLFPVPRKNYTEYFISQFDGDNVYFTLKDDYHKYQEESPVYLTMSYYPDLLDTKGIVLMRGAYDEKVLTAMEAQLLATQLGLYYGRAELSQTFLLYAFNKEAVLFRPQMLHMELEKMGLTPTT